MGINVRGVKVEMTDMEHMLQPPWYISSYANSYTKGCTITVISTHLHPLCARQIR